MFLTVLLVRIYIFVLPNEYSFAEIGKSLKRLVTPSTDPSPLQCGHVWLDSILYRSKKFSYSSLKTYPWRRSNVVSTSLKWSIFSRFCFDFLYGFNYFFYNPDMVLIILISTFFLTLDNQVDARLGMCWKFSVVLDH